MKSSKVPIKTRSTPASLSFKGQATKHTTVKWSIVMFIYFMIEIELKLCHVLWKSEVHSTETGLGHHILMM